MSGAAAASAPAAPRAARPWGLWRRQVLAVLRLEARKTFFGKRTVPIYLLALLPVLLFLGRALFARLVEDDMNIATSISIYGSLYQTFILRMCVFFGCVGIFTNLFRGEFLDRSLHFYFLAPIRRDVLLVGKYLSGLVAATVIFCGSTAASALLNYVPHGKAIALDHLFRGPGLRYLLAYLGVTALACVGYGAVFMTIGLFFKNPVIPALPILGWESLLFLLPPFLKKISIIHYLQSLCPFQIFTDGPFALIAEPSSPWIAVPGLLAVSAVALLIGAWKVRRFEIMYGAD